MAIKANQVVTINYTVTEEEGQTVDATIEGKPFAYLSGHNQILPKLEKKIETMLIGSKSTIELAPKDAYGEYDEKAVQTVNRSEFPEGTDLKRGMQFIANTPEGQQMPLVIKDVKDDEITVDFNHALTGKTLSFDVELVDVRDATPEEMTHGHVHGPGGHHH